MAKQVLKDATVLWGAHNLSSYCNRVDHEVTVETPDATNFGSGGWKEPVHGLATTAVGFGGFFDTAATATVDKDGDLFSGLVDAPFTVYKANPVAAADVGFSVRGDRANYQPAAGGPVGELLPMNATLFANQRSLRTTCLLYDAVADGSVTGGTVTLGAVAAGQSVYAVLQIGGVVSGAPTLDVLVLSATTDWATPSTHITFTQETNATARYQNLSAAGPETDTFWRVETTYGGTGSFSDVVVSVAIV